jgi:hypothetical protein
MDFSNFEKKETVERYVTALYERGAYNSEIPFEAVCLTCGFTMDSESGRYASVMGMGKSLQVDLSIHARFCPICGSRFNRRAEYGLYPQELDPSEETKVVPLQVRKLSEADYRELIGDELFERLAELPEYEEEAFSIYGTAVLR